MVVVVQSTAVVAGAAAARHSPAAGTRLSHVGPEGTYEEDPEHAVAEGSNGRRRTELDEGRPLCCVEERKKTWQ